MVGSFVVDTVLSKSSGSHSKDYIDCHLLEYVTVETGKILTSLIRNVLPSNANYCICINGLFSDVVLDLTEANNRTLNEF
jgi:hypothetical protein